jgi:hypothetical protein
LIHWGLGGSPTSLADTTHLGTTNRGRMMIGELEQERSPVSSELRGRLERLLPRLEQANPQEHTADVLAILGTCGVMASPDWARWAFSAEAARLLADDREVARAPLESLLMLLAAHAFGERECVGHLALELRSGRLQHLLRCVVFRLQERERGEGGYAPSGPRSGIRLRTV